MAEKLSSLSRTFVPDYRLVVLRDMDTVGPTEGENEALSSASRDIAGSNGYKIFVVAVQGLEPVAYTVEIWDGEPDLAAAYVDWSLALRSDLWCPTGELALSDPTGGGLDVIEPPGKAGSYTVAIFHRGRQQAWEHQQAILEALHPAAALEELWVASGTEQYLFCLWRRADFCSADRDVQD